MIKLTVTTVGGNEFVFDDSVNAGSGMSALTQLASKQVIHAIADASGTATEVYIPFHAVAKAVCERDGQVVPITDDLCGGGGEESVQP